MLVTNTVTGEVTRFVYDGDGKRVKATVNGVTTVYIGDYYEQSGNTVRKYYYAGGQRIAVRVDGTLYFLHSDHLGSATLATDVSGNRVGEVRYKPYGEVRYSWGVMPTDRLYTGQRWDGALGLYDYRARYYDPALGRFISADPLVPELGNPQSLNRYAYVLNNPIRYNDPTGYAYECGVYAGTSCADVGPKFPVEIIQAPPDALDNVWAVTEFVGAVVLEPADWVLTARDFLGGQGSPWALVGLLPLVPSSVGKYADEAADALRRAREAGEAAPQVVRQLYEKGVLSGIRPAGEWESLLQDMRQKAGLEVHHLIERRFAERLGLRKSEIPAVVLDRTFHQQEVTARLFRELPTNPRRVFTPQEIWNAYRKVYGAGPKGLNRQDWLEAIWPYFKQLGVQR